MSTFSRILLYKIFSSAAWQILRILWQLHELMTIFRLSSLNFYFQVHQIEHYKHICLPTLIYKAQCQKKRDANYLILIVLFFEFNFCTINKMCLISIKHAASEDKNSGLKAWRLFFSPNFSVNLFMAVDKLYYSTPVVLQLIRLE